MKTIASLLSVVGFVLISAAPAFSQDSLPVENAVRYEVQLSHASSQPAALRIVALDDISDIDVLLNSCAPKVVKQHIDRIPKGENYIMQWQQPTGAYNCQIQMRGKSQNGGSWKVLNNFEMNSLAPLGLKTDLAGLSPEVHSLTLHATQPVKRVTVTVRAEDGSDIDQVVMDLPTLQKDVTVTWKESPQMRRAVYGLRIRSVSSTTFRTRISSLIPAKRRSVRIRNRSFSILYARSNPIARVFTTSRRIFISRDTPTPLAALRAMTN